MTRTDFEDHFYTQDCIKAMYRNRGYPRFKDEIQSKGRRICYYSEIGQPFADALMDRLLYLGEKRI